MHASEWQRQTVRIHPPEGMELVLHIAQDGMEGLDVDVLDISAGGCRIVLPPDASSLKMGIVSSLKLFWCVDQRIWLQGVLLNIHHHSDALVTGHLRFGMEDPRALQAISALVCRLERIHLRVKSGWGHPAHENLQGRMQTYRHHTRQSLCRHC